VSKTNVRNNLSQRFGEIAVIGAENYISQSRRSGLDTEVQYRHGAKALR
jgi:hypothetical protein